jgi:hypothetical protein
MAANVFLNGASAGAPTCQTLNLAETGKGMNTFYQKGDPPHPTFCQSDRSIGIVFTL